jgi:Transglutaminase-like superfamily
VTQMLELEARSRPWSGIRRVHQQPPGGALLPLRAVLFGLAVPALLRLPLDRLAGWLEAAPAAPERPELRTAEPMVRRIDAALRAAWPLVRRGCLTRGLTQLWFLRRAGFPVSLRFGMGEIDGRIEGHCWLVLDGEPLAEKRDPRPIYTETWRIPREKRLEGAVHPLGSLPD